MLRALRFVMSWLLAEVTGVVEGTTTSVFALRHLTLVMTLVLSRLSFALALVLSFPLPPPFHLW